MVGECERTEVGWEDSWLDFLNETLEFAVAHLDSALLEVTVHPAYHAHEARECPKFLAVVEKITGEMYS